MSKRKTSPRQLSPIAARRGDPSRQVEPLAPKPELPAPTAAGDSAPGSTGADPAPAQEPVRASAARHWAPLARFVAQEARIGAWAERRPLSLIL
ncbi:MAG TPA: hypothetical protein VFR19_14510, partial [Hyphomicrobiaceae bacterium]|nr:hypothetical protein [Hyphomicrobiaceae bacterium]